jgi:hypothetical protein
LFFKESFINLFVITATVMFFILFIPIYNSNADSQKTIIPRSYHVLNNSIIVTPPLEGVTKKVYEPKYENYSIVPHLSKSIPLNNSLSYTITNATITAINKLTNGTIKADSSEPSQITVIPEEKIVNGRK